MAFTCRSSRPAYTQPSNPGPGSYSTENRSAEHGYAPFLSTAARKFHPDSSTSPGPGRYTLQQAQKQSSHAPQASLSAPFSTSGARLGQYKSTSAVTPGPGYYSKDVASKWGTKSRRAQRDAAAARVSLQRQVTAPSVPARSQVYGYEEDNAGRLVMQPPPNQGHTGVGTDRPGPLDYDPDKLKVMKCSAATGWGKSKAERRTAPGGKAHVRNTVVPGPGDYNPAATQTQTGFTRGAPGPIAGTGKTSSFATTALRLTQSRETFQRAPPGPGDYSIQQSTDAIRAPKPVPKHQQFFSSTSRRPSEVDPVKLLSAPSYIKGPGPGAYDADSGFGRQPLADPACSAFSSTQVRLKGGQEGKPGPGEYDAGDEFSLFSNMTRKVSSRCTMFGSSGARFAAEQSNRAEGVLAASDMPGPQSYNPVSSQKAAAHPSSNFSSRTKRMATTKPPTEPKPSEFEADDDVLGDPRNLGPGSYNVPMDWASRSKHGTYKPIPGFGGAERFQAQKNDVPAPGTYDWKDVDRALKPVARQPAAFGVSDSKLSAWTARIPGPGQYETAASWRLRSYNVSYDDTNLV